MFSKLFGGNASPEKVNDAVSYFFAFSLNLLKKDGPYNLSESEKYDFRNNYILKEKIDNYGIGFFSKIELESTNFTNHHFSQNTSHQIKDCCKPTLNQDSPITLEVKNYLESII